MLNICLTHLHLDHVEGLGFFAPLWREGWKLRFWGPPSATATLRERVSRYLSPPLFPVGLSEAPFPLDELYWGIRKLLEALAADRPLVAVFEDLHWAEPALLDLLVHVAETSTGAPIVVIGTARPELEERHPDWLDLDGTAEIRLAPLEGEAVEV